MISHRNVIANSIQFGTYDSMARKHDGFETQVALGLLPFSHIYGLEVVAYGSIFRGDEVIVLPKFDLQTFLKAVQDFKIAQLYIVSSSLCTSTPQGGDIVL